MNHSAVVNLVNKLFSVPTPSSPEDVMIKAATDRNLSPGVLEKMGQIYNMATQVHHMENAAEGQRGASVRQVKPADMRERYVDQMPKKAHKPVKPVSGHSLGFEVNVDELFSDAWQEFGDKAASADDIPQRPVQHQEVIDSYRHSLDMDIQLRKRAGALMAAKVQAGSGSDRTFDIAAEEQDVAAISTVEIAKMAGDAFEAHVAREYSFLPYTPTVERAVSFFKRAMEVQTSDNFDEFGALVASCVDKVLATDSFRKTAAAYCNAHRKSIYDVYYSTTGVTLSKEAASPFEALLDDPPEIENSDPDSGAAPVSILQAPGSQQSRARPSDGEEKKDSGGDIVLSDTPVAEKEKAQPSGGREKASPSGARDKMMDSLIGDNVMNNAQQQADDAVDEIKKAIMLRRILATDDVLKHMPPAKVTAAFNAINARNPNLPTDKESIILQLRQVVDQDGLTLDGVNNLVKAKGDEAKADAAARSERDQKYRTSAPKLPILKAPSS